MLHVSLCIISMASSVDVVDIAVIKAMNVYKKFSYLHCQASLRAPHFQINFRHEPFSGSPMLLSSFCYTGKCYVLFTETHYSSLHICVETLTRSDVIVSFVCCINVFRFRTIFSLFSQIVGIRQCHFSNR